MTQPRTREAMLQYLVDVIYAEIVDIKAELDAATREELKRKLRYTLRDLSAALSRLLELAPEEATEDGLLTIITRAAETIDRVLRASLSAGL